MSYQRLVSEVILDHLFDELLQTPTVSCVDSHTLFGRRPTHIYFLSLPLLVHISPRCYGLIVGDWRLENQFRCLDRYSMFGVCVTHNSSPFIAYPPRSRSPTPSVSFPNLTLATFTSFTQFAFVWRPAVLLLDKMWCFHFDVVPFLEPPYHSLHVGLFVDLRPANCLAALATLMEDPRVV